MAIARRGRDQVAGCVVHADRGRSSAPGAVSPRCTGTAARVDGLRSRGLKHHTGSDNQTFSSPEPWFTSALFSARQTYWWGVFVTGLLCHVVPLADSAKERVGPAPRSVPGASKSPSQALERSMRRVLMAVLATVLALAVSPSQSVAHPQNPIPLSVASGEAGTYVPLSPSRLMDTRKNLGAVGPVAAQGTVRLQVAGRGGVPASGVAAVVLNVTVTAPTKSGYVTAYPDGTTLPTASNLNFTAGQTIPNLVIVKVGSNGKVALKNSSAGTVQLIADVAGYYLDAITVGAISGKVTDSAGNGLAGPVVEMSSPTVGGGAGDVNSDGTFNTGFFLPVADDYTVCFRTYGDETGGISDAFGYLDACWSGLVAVVAGKVTSGINVALPTGGAIEGRVVDSSNQPIQDVRVSVSSDSTNSSRTVWTNADGTYRAKGLATASDFHVCFYPTDDTLTSKCWNNQPWDGSPDPVSATAGAIRSGIDAVLEPAP